MKLNPGQKGWLKEYLEFRKESLSQQSDQNNRKSKPKPRTPDESLYSVLQPTGFMYGHPVQYWELKEDDMKDWNEEHQVKLLLAESLINSALIYHEEKIDNVEDFSEIILKTISNISDFYNNVYPELSTSTKTLFGKKREPLDVAEKILEKRIDLNPHKEKNFWVNFFHNSLLFLDIYFFGQWIHTNTEKAVSEFFRQEKEDLRFSVIKVIVAAAHANQIIEDEERKLFEFFLNSAKLSPQKEKEALIFLDQGITVDEIEIPGNSWILRKFYLELAILTVWADKKVEESELQFLEEFSSTIGLSDEDLENSMIAIEGFVIEHWEALGQLQSKHDLQKITEEYLERVQRVLSRNKNRITHEINESRELRSLLRKSKYQDLNPEEQEIIRTELITILKMIPTFVIISLPSTYLTLPILLKILPTSIFPQTEQENKNDHTS